MRGRVLVVDDEPGMLRAVERVLAADYTTLALGSPAEALARAAEFEPDLALLDVRMPGMSGLDLMDRLREIRPDLDVILMTGSVSETDATHVEALLRKAFYFVQKPFDRRVLLTLVERCLALRRLESENRRHVLRLEREMAEARTFQESLLPAPEARLGRVAVAARWIPTAELGGDFVDYAECGDGAVALLVADVVGHGASAAMLTGIVKSAFDSSRAECCDPLAVVRRVVEAIRTFEPRRFITLLAIRLDPVRGTLEWVNAGHPPGIVWSRDRAPVFLDPTGMFVSPAFPDQVWTASSLAVRPGDRVLLLTDGILEIERNDTAFGLEGVLDLIKKRPEGGAALLDDLLNAAREFAGAPAADDLTLLTASLA